MYNVHLESFENLCMSSDLVHLYSVKELPQKTVFISCDLQQILSRFSMSWGQEDGQGSLPASEEPNIPSTVMNLRAWLG